MITLRNTDLVIGHLRGNEPILISDGAADWPAAHSWSPAYLASVLAHRVVDVALSLTGSFRYHPDGTPLDPGNQFIVTNIPFKDAVEGITDSSTSSPKYYISQQDILAKLPELLADLRFPNPAKPDHLNLWFGSAGTVTPLHFDASNNLYAQIFGSKQFTIFSPDDTKYLYPFPQGSRLAHLSYLDLEHADGNRYPLLANAQPISFRIEPGQLLFLPAFWWHHVRSSSVSISVNQWWAPEPSQCNSASAELVRPFGKFPKTPDPGNVSAAAEPAPNRPDSDEL